MGIVFVAIDLAKNVFAVHGVNAAGKAEVVRPYVPCTNLGEVMVALPLEQRRGHWPTVAAIAAKSARMAWAPPRQAEKLTMPT